VAAEEARAEQLLASAFLQEGPDELHGLAHQVRQR
jgi:hypothetical protein